MFHKLLFFTAFLFLALQATAQNASIKGHVTSDTEGILEFVNVLLLSAEDSTLVKAEITDEKGGFLIPGLRIGNYRIQASYVGMPEFYSDIITITAPDQEITQDVMFTTKGLDLDEITVTAKKPLLEVKSDRTIFNVEGSISASGTDAFELLRKAPGIVIDNSDNLLMMGKAGVRVYFDGKPTPLTGDDLAQFLKNTPSDEIEAIEVITNPGAKYEAEGNAGIINIRFRKSDKKGANGSLSMNLSQGRKTRGNIAFNGNYKTPKVNSYINTSLYKGENFNDQFIYRNQSGGIFDQKTYGGGDWQGFNVRGGVDYNINDFNTIGALVTTNSNLNNWGNDSKTYISRVETPTQIDSVLISSSDNRNNNQTFTYNLNYRFDNKKGTTLNVDLDRGNYNYKSNETQPNSYYLPDETTFLQRSDVYFDKPKDIMIQTAKLDYTYAWGQKSIEAGGKLSQVVTDNTFDYFDVLNGVNIINPDFSNTFTYDEKVYAGYTNFKQQVSEKFGYNAGIRVEHTDSEGELKARQNEQNKTITPRKYTDLFPSAGISYVFNPKNAINLNYSRRLNRPDYEVLNPFRSRLDELTYEKGNEDLTPEYSTNLSMTHTYNNFLNTTLTYSRTKNMITRILGKPDDPDRQNETYITWENLALQNAYSINVAAPVPIKDWWSTYTSLSTVYTSNSGNVLNEEVNLNVTSFNAYMQQSFTLPNEWSAELTGWYTSPTIWGGTVKMESMWSVGMGIQKSFFNKKLKTKLNVRDIFYTERWNGRSIFAGTDLKVNGNEDSRRVTLSLTYGFGNDKIKVKKRNSGLDDEQSRIGGDNN